MVITILQTLHQLLTQAHHGYFWVAKIFSINLLLVSVCFGAVGKISYQSQPAQITRSGKKILTEKNTLIEMNDVVETLDGVVHLVFEDDTKVKIKEYSELVIDDFVYEPSTKKGKLNLKATIGNIRYTSGLIANKENIKINTPTASVSVRGTDFNIIVAESGQTSFTLLPSIDNSGNEYTGKIEISNISGSVLLTIPFENTVVTSILTPPSPPLVLSQSKISKIKRQEKEDKQDEVKDEDEGEDKEEPEQEPEQEKEEITEEKIVDKEEIIHEEDLIVTEEKITSVFTEINNKLYFIRDENQNKVKISFDPTASISVNYENQGKIISGNHNNGGQVIININQQ